MIVVIDVHAIAVPFPIPAAIQVVRSNYPIGVVVEYDAPRPVIDPACDKDFSHMPVATTRIGPTGLYAVVIVVPVAIMRILWIVPTFVFPIVVAVVAVFVFVLAFVFPLIAMVVPALSGCRDRQRPGQRHEQCPSYDFAHKSSLQRLRCRSTSFRLRHPIIVGTACRRYVGAFSYCRGCKPIQTMIGRSAFQIRYCSAKQGRCKFLAVEMQSRRSYAL